MSGRLRLSSLRDINRTMDIERQRRREESRRETFEETLRLTKEDIECVECWKFFWEWHGATKIIQLPWSLPNCCAFLHPRDAQYKTVFCLPCPASSLTGRNVKGRTLWRRKSKDFGGWGDRKGYREKLTTKPWQAKTKSRNQAEEHHWLGTSWVWKM